MKFSRKTLSLKRAPASRHRALLDFKRSRLKLHRLRNKTFVEENLRSDSNSRIESAPQDQQSDSEIR